MTIVEFYDTVQIENMAGVVGSNPDRVIFVGDKKEISRHIPCFQRFLNSRGMQVKLEAVGVNVQRLDEIVRKLEGIVQESLRSGEEIYFDLTGGKELPMAAIGILFERYHEQGVHLRSYHIRSRKIYDCNLEGDTLKGYIPGITVEQSILLNCGSVVSQEQKNGGTIHWDFNEDFMNDINTFWNLCRENPGTWNFRVIALNGALATFEKSGDGLSFHCGDIPALKARIRQEHYDEIGLLLESLSEKGLITDYVNDEFELGFSYKNHQVKTVLEKAGDVLELTTCTAAMLAQENGQPVFNDVRTGVFIDWDADIHSGDHHGIDTENEIDVILMRGLVPIFISCKNGVVDDEELYKLNTVAERFGGQYARKVLIATTLGRKSPDAREYFLDRAKVMGIKVLTDVHHLTRAEMTELLLEQCR